MNISNYTKGILAAIVSCTIWGLSGVLYFYLKDVQPTEIIAHRAIWGFVVIIIFCYFTNRINDYLCVLRNKKTTFLLLLSSIFVSINWLVFVWAVQRGFGVSASLGYYIMPLLNVIFGVLFLSEKIDKIKIISISIAAIGVMILAIGLGTPPWVALFLAISFSTYSLIRKIIQVCPILGTLVEFTILLIPAFIWLFGVHMFNWQGFTDISPAAFGRDLKTTLLLISSGIFALPLILYTYAAKEIGLSTTGLFFYLNPTIQLIVAGTLLAEDITIYHYISLSLIWLALIIISIHSFTRPKNN